MRNILFILIMLLCHAVKGQQPSLYDPAANASGDIREAVQKAGKEKKHVLIQAGGNWCGWCIEFERFAKADSGISNIIDVNYIWYHLNYSKENKNEDVFARLEFPQRFGFPVFIILDGQGKRIHTQSSEYLEDGKKSYDGKKVSDFLLKWTPKAVDPSTYSKP